jgi:RNA polymerase sigma factor (sigma-70 family)
VQTPLPPPAGDLGRLLRLAAGGDQHAWNELVDRFTGLLWATCRAHRLSPADAGDVCQLTWLRLLEHLDTIRDPARLPGWLATTCRRECLVLLRQQRRLQPVEDERLLGAGDDDVPADRAVLVEDRDAVLWRAFGELGERCRGILEVLVVLAEDGPPSYRSAAQALGVPVGTLGPTRGRCLARLRELLEAEGISGPGSDS